MLLPKENKGRVVAFKLLLPEYLTYHHLFSSSINPLEKFPIVSFGLASIQFLITGNLLITY